MCLPDCVTWHERPGWPCLLRVQGFTRHVRMSAPAVPALKFAWRDKLPRFRLVAVISRFLVVVSGRPSLPAPTHESNGSRALAVMESLPRQ